MSDNTYMREYMALRWQERRKKAIDLLGGKCVHCGDIEDLHFDHIDPNTKLFTIASSPGRNENDFLAELGKCQLLCEPCHIEKTKIDNFRPITHGKPWAFIHNKCKCNVCNAARVLFNAERRKKRQQRVLS